MAKNESNTHMHLSINQKNLTWPRQQAAATRPGGESD